MRPRFIFFLYLCVAAGFAYSQPAGPQGFDANANLSNASNSMFRSFDNRYKGVKGFSTVFEDFVYGNVNMKSGERAEGQELNYDAITNELIVRSRIYKRILAVRSDLVESFELINVSGDTLFFKKVTEKGFCQVVYEGKTKVYLKYAKRIEKANYGGAYNSNARTSDEIVELNIYLISKDGEPLEEIKATRKAFESKFADKKDAIREYMKQFKPDLKDSKQMADFVTYLEKQE